jgi:hypothetical protein
MEPLDSERKKHNVEGVLEWARRFDSHLAIFPAGLLPVEFDDEVRAKARPLIQAARRHETGIVFGIDSRKNGWLIAWCPGMRSARIWRGDVPAPCVLQVESFRVSILSDRQAEEASLRRAAAAARCDLVTICGRLTLAGHRQPADYFRGLGVPVTRSAYTFKPEIPPLVCPRGYRLPNISAMERDFMVASFYIDDSDGALNAGLRESTGRISPGGYLSSHGQPDGTSPARMGTQIDRRFEERL